MFVTGKSGFETVNYALFSAQVSTRKSFFGVQLGKSILSRPGTQGSHSLEKSLNFIIILEKSWIAKNPWKVLEFHDTVLKSPWIFPNIESEASQQSCIVKITVFFRFNFVKMTNKKNTAKKQSRTRAKMWADTRFISGCVYELKCSCVCHMELAWHYGVEALCWHLFCSKMPGKCICNHNWLLIWFVQNDSLC